MILTIISESPGNNLADIPEQGLKISGQRIAGAMQVPNQLVEIIAQPS
jgi:hypothetical protein